MEVLRLLYSLGDSSCYHDKNANIKNFEGGRGGGAEKIFVLDFFGFFVAL